jgi:pilus assembly protein CpaE
VSALQKPLPIEWRAPSELMSFVADEPTVAMLAGALEDWPGAEFELGGIEAAITYFATEPSPRYLLVDLAGIPTPLAAIGRLADVCGPTTDLIAIGEFNDVEFYRALRAAGVADYLVKPVSAEAVAATLRTLQQDSEAPTVAKFPKQADSVIAVIGACGGVGATMVASSLAWISAREHRRRTVLVDLDIHYGGAALAFNVAPNHGLSEILANPRLIDGLLVSSAATSLGDSLSLLCSEEPLESPVAVNPGALEPLVAQLRSDFHRILLDVPRRDPELLRQSLAQATTIILVTDFSLAAARDTRRMLALARSAAPEARMLVLANRFSGARKGMPARAEIEEVIGVKLAALIPEDNATVPRALNVGKPLPEIAPTSKPSAALRAFAASLGKTAPNRPATRLSRLFATLKPR